MIRNKIAVLSAFAILGAISLSGTKMETKPMAAPLAMQRGVRRAVSSEVSFSTVGNASYSYADGAITLNSNTDKNQGYYLTSDYDAYGDYTISATFKGTVSFPSSKETDIGLVPWYIDSNNYVLVYMNWSNTDRPNQLREIQITGKIGGSNLIIKGKENTTWTSKQWNDNWTDGNVTKQNQDNTLSVTKTRTSSGESDLFTVYVNGTQLAYLEVRDTVRYDYKKSKVGVYGYNDTITFSDFSFASNKTAGQFAGFDAGVLSTTDAVEVSSSGYSISAASSGSETAYLVDNINAASGYQIDLGLAKTTGNTPTEISAVAYYENEYTYLNAGVFYDNGTLVAGFDGLITQSITTALNQTEISQLVALSNLTLDEITSIKVTKSSSVFKLYVNEELITSYSNAFFVSGTSGADKLYGFKTEGYSGTISLDNNTYKEEYVYLTQNMGGKTYYVSSKDDGGVTYSSGTFNFGENAITAGNSNKLASVYTGSSRYGNVSISAKFVTSEDTVYGLNAYLKDVDNYTRVYVKDGKLYIDEVADGTSKSSSQSLPAEYVNASIEGHTMETSVNEGILTVTLDGTKIVEGEEISVDYHSEANVGFVVGATTATVSAVAIDGFEPLDPIDRDGFTFFGQRVDSWSYDKENGVISNKLITGVENGWKATNALYPNTEKKDLYIGANIQVSKMEGTEWKVGLMPYYKDADNHVIVWFSQWSGAGTKIVVTARLNGQTIGSEWRESGDVGVDMSKENYLEAKIEGDKVSVYINKSYTASMETTVEGLSNRNMEMAFTGFQVGNGMQATFKEFTMISDKRVYGFEEKPQLIETGARKTTGTVGTSIALPIYTAENSAGDFLTPVVSVTDPVGNAVTVSKNRFTPESEGNYTVRVTCTDSWGNEADPIEYTIAVTAAGGGSSSSNDSSSSSQGSSTSSESGSSGGCGGSIAATGGIVAALAAAGIGLAAYKKKKEKK